MDDDDDVSQKRPFPHVLVSHLVMPPATQVKSASSDE